MYLCWLSDKLDFERIADINELFMWRQFLCRFTPDSVFNKSLTLIMTRKNC